MDPDILALLQSQLEESRERYRTAKEKHREVFDSDEQPTASAGNIHPETSFFVRKIIAEERDARRRYFDAMMRLNSYLLNQVVPEDIKEILAKKSRSAGRE